MPLFVSQHVSILVFNATSRLKQPSHALLSMNKTETSIFKIKFRSFVLAGHHGQMNHFPGIVTVWPQRRTGIETGFSAKNQDRFLDRVLGRRSLDRKAEQ